MSLRPNVSGLTSYYRFVVSVLKELKVLYALFLAWYDMPSRQIGSLAGSVLNHFHVRRQPFSFG